MHTVCASFVRNHLPPEIKLITSSFHVKCVDDSEYTISQCTRICAFRILNVLHMKRRTLVSFVAEADSRQDFLTLAAMKHVSHLITSFLQGAACACEFIQAAHLVAFVLIKILSLSSPILSGSSRERRRCVLSRCGKWDGCIFLLGGKGLVKILIKMHRKCEEISSWELRTWFMLCANISHFFAKAPLKLINWVQA